MELDASQPSAASAAAALVVVVDDEQEDVVVAMEKNPRTPVSLPDLDDTSMNKVFTYLEFYEQDLAWSFFSDSFFIVGGLLYVILCVWDLREEEVVDNNNKNSIESSNSIEIDIYALLTALAPLAYVLNSLIDIQWAYHAKLRNKIKMEVKNQWMEYQDIYTTTATDSNNGEAVGALQAVQKIVQFPLFQLVRKHAAHRRTILAAFTFGMAALCGFLAVLVPYKNEKAAVVLDFLSAHLYIVSAVIATSGQRTRPWFATLQWSIISRNPEILEDIGDALFLIGSLVDAALFDFGLEKPILSSLSSLLWLIDACFYLRSDFVMAHQIQDKQDVCSDSFVFV